MPANLRRLCLAGTSCVLDKTEYFLSQNQEMVVPQMITSQKEIQQRFSTVLWLNIVRKTMPLIDH